MTAATMLDTFLDRGLVRVPAAFTTAQASAMSDAIWRHVTRTTPCRRNDPSTWNGRPINFKKLKAHSSFAALTRNTATSKALDGIFGAGQWTNAKAGPQILMTFPNAAQWQLPNRLWHTDSGFEHRTFPPFGVKLFACVEPVRPGGGGTLAIAGSHRMVERYRPTLARDERGAVSAHWSGVMRQDPWLRQVAHPNRTETGALMDGPHDADGIELEIVELTGEPGDVWITHLHTFHCVSPNARDTPRMMIAEAIHRGQRPPA